MMTIYVTCLLVAFAATIAASPSDSKVVRMKRNYEQPYDLQFHNAVDEEGLVRIKRGRRDVGSVKDDAEAGLTRVKRQRRDVKDDTEAGLTRVKRERRDINSVHDMLEAGLARLKRGEEELERVKRGRRDVEEVLQRMKRTDDEEGLDRVKRTRREAEKKTVEKAVRSNHKEHKAQKLLKREKKTNMNHHWQKHEKRAELNKHHFMKRKINEERGLLTGRALQNIHMIDKRSNHAALKHRVKRQHAHHYNKLEADVAKLGRLRRDIALNLQKFNVHDLPHHRAKRTHYRSHKSFKKH